MPLLQRTSLVNCPFPILQANYMKYKSRSGLSFGNTDAIASNEAYYGELLVLGDGEDIPNYCEIIYDARRRKKNKRCRMT